jgi:hypothetical protein
MIKSSDDRKQYLINRLRDMIDTKNGNGSGSNGSGSESNGNGSGSNGSESNGSDNESESKGSGSESKGSGSESKGSGSESKGSGSESKGSGSEPNPGINKPDISEPKQGSGPKQEEAIEPSDGTFESRFRHTLLSNDTFNPFEQVVEVIKEAPPLIGGNIIISLKTIKEYINKNVNNITPK